MSEEGPDVDVDDVQDETSTAVKRKADIDEIEVDLAAPEPPSKRAKRALKKGKALPAKSGSDNNNNDDDLQEGEDKAAKEGKKRSEWSVWIGNLPFNVSAADIKNWLVTNSGGTLQPEAVTRVNVPKSKDPTRAKDAKPQNKGFAYVDFADQGGQVAAMALSESDLQGRKLLIKNATSFEGRPKKEAAAAATEPQSADQVAEFKKQQDASRKVFVGNMSFKTTEDDVRRNFEKCGEIDWVKIATFEDTGKCKGYGWVKFREPESAAWAVKGFVKIKEEVETAEDFDEDAAPAEEGGGEDRQRQYKTRKWWVNRLMGRELKLELAEDDQTRYKKRFRGGGRDKAEGGKREGKREGKGRFSNKGKDQDGQDGGAPIVEVPTRNDAPLKESTDISVAKLTGAMVKPTGSKVTFD